MKRFQGEIAAVFLLISVAYSGCQNSSGPTAIAGDSLVIHGGATSASRYYANTNTFLATGNLPVAAAQGALSFAISSGAYKGKIITVPVNGTTTGLYNPTTQVYSVGPALPSSLSNSVVGFPRHDAASPGYHVVVDGAQPGNTVQYVSTTSSWSSTFVAVTPGSKLLTWTFSEGTNHYTSIIGSIAPFLWIFHHEGGAVIPFSPAPFIVGNGGHGISIPSGANAGYGLAVLAGGQATTVIIHAAVGIVTFGPNISVTPYPNGGACSFVVSRGNNLNKIIVVHAGGSNVTSMYDTITNSFSTGPILTAIAGDGAHTIQINSGPNIGKTIVIHGGGLTSTSLYQPTTNTFVPGPALPAPVTTGGHSVAIP
jgi:hypothetical protein